MRAMKLKDNLTIRVGCEKYELILDMEHKKSFVGTMLCSMVIIRWNTEPLISGARDMGLSIRGSFLIGRIRGFCGI